MPLDLHNHSAPWRYGLAVLVVAVALLVTLISQRFGLANRSAAFLAAILLTGWYAGTGPTVVALVLSTFAFDFFFLPPVHTIGLQLGPDPYMVWFLLFGVLAAWFSAARRRNALLLEQARDELEQQVAVRTAELRRSEAYLVAAQELSHTGSWARRLATGEVHWSDETFRIFGRDPRGPAPASQQLLQIWHPADRDLIDQTMGAATREKRGFELDARVVRPDGSIRYVHTKAQPIFDASGDVVEFMGVVMDVTDRKLAERALRRARERTLEARFAAMLAERTRLAREIHDTLLQGFTGVGLRLVAAAKRVTGQPEATAALREVSVLAQQTLEDARRAVWDMRSPALAGGEFTATLRATAEESIRGTGITLEYVVEGSPRPTDPEVEAVALRVVQEAIANTVKHAAARTLRVRCVYGARRVRLSITDDGEGFTVDPDFRAYGGHWGLLGMRERAGQIGGKVSVRSAPTQGTRITLLAPYEGRSEPRPRPASPAS
jgi:PAS domain S-box-containing protein